MRWNTHVNKTKSLVKIALVMESIQATTELCFKILMASYYWVVDNFAIADEVYTYDKMKS